jgi:hypothetical protein
MIRARLVCTLSRGQEAKRPGPFASSRHDEIQFEFRDGGCNEVISKDYFILIKFDFHLLSFYV